MPPCLSLCPTFSLSEIPQPKPWYSLRLFMLGSLVRLVTSLVSEPAGAVTTLLYYSDLLPQSIVLAELSDGQ
ncbi:unnamed protein product [Camellia sinensis]